MSELSSADIAALVRAAVEAELAKHPVPDHVPVVAVDEPETALDVLKRCVAQLHVFVVRDRSVTTGSGDIHAAIVEALDAILQVVVDNAQDIKGTE